MTVSDTLNTLYNNLSCGLKLDNTFCPLINLFQCTTLLTPSFGNHLIAYYLFFKTPTYKYDIVTLLHFQRRKKCHKIVKLVHK